MASPETWIQALSRTSGEARFTLDFARLELQAQCRSLTAAEISQALALSGEAAARQLLYLSCPSLQQAGNTLVQQGTLTQPQDITLELPYSDVLQAAAMILQHSGAGAGMVQFFPGTIQKEHFEMGSPMEDAAFLPRAGMSITGSTVEASPVGEIEMDGYALLRQWVAEDRKTQATGQNPVNHQISSVFSDAFSATLALRQPWAAENAALYRQAEATNSALSASGAQLQSHMTTSEQVAELLCQRLCDAAGNM